MDTVLPAMSTYCSVCKSESLVLNHQPKHSCKVMYRKCTVLLNLDGSFKGIFTVIQQLTYFNTNRTKVATLYRSNTFQGCCETCTNFTMIPWFLCIISFSSRWRITYCRLQWKSLRALTAFWKDIQETYLEM